MSARQAVWPAELAHRRREVLMLQAQITAVLAHPHAGTAHATLVEPLRRRLAQIPCPHWDVHLAAGATEEWVCDDCAQTIVARWVPLQNQENTLRRAQLRRPPAGH